MRGVAGPEEATFDDGTVNVLDRHHLRPGSVTVGHVSAAAGKASVEWVLEAGRLAREGRVDAIATAPINKEVASAAGYKDIGHMELLQQLSEAPEVATMLMSGHLRVVHLTTHRSLRRACDAVTQENVLAKLRLTRAFFQGQGITTPRIAVAALNPHASDGGLLGDEEAREIDPAVQAARAEGIAATGPVPADTVFTQAIQGQYDVVLALYHDQGHIAVKVHGWERSISVTLGLPFVRTSVDHGTAFDIAGKGVASAQSMAQAVRVAVALATGKGLPA